MKTKFDTDCVPITTLTFRPCARRNYTQNMSVVVTTLHRSCTANAVFDCSRQTSTHILEAASDMSLFEKFSLSLSLSPSPSLSLYLALSLPLSLSPSLPLSLSLALSLPLSLSPSLPLSLSLSEYF